MNVLFITLCRITDINERNIYTDLMRKMRNEGNSVYIVTPSERRYNGKTVLEEQEGVSILSVRTLNIQKTNIVEKGIGTILLEHQINNAVKRFLGHVRFDLILYSTPPITLTRVIASIKRRTGATSYLMLKDIFPQNAVDLGMISRRGLLYRYFRRKEERLYSLSDYIGCMSPANVKYLLSANPWLNKDKVEVCPNSIEIRNDETSQSNRDDIRLKYGLPLDKTVFIYGGNLGKPQGVDALIELIKSSGDMPDVFFLIVGSGTEYQDVFSWFKENNPSNAMLIPGLPKSEYDLLVEASDVGLIFLDKRFTIPNYPSRILTYMENGMPVIAATDLSTDIGAIAEENGYGFWSFSGDINKLKGHISKLSDNPALINRMGVSGNEFLRNNYSVDTTYNVIISHF